MGYTNSPLVDYTRISPNRYVNRKHTIDRITPHCIVGQWTVEQIGNCFAPTSKGASCNYGIAKDGKVALIVEEKDGSWCSSSESNDRRAVTIECASDTTHPYAFRTEVYEKLIKLCADICKRNGKTKLLWLGDKTQTLNYAPKSNEMVLTVHRWFKTKACPGDWLMARMGDLASKVNALLNTDEAKKEDDEVVSEGKIITNGKEYKCDRILKNDENFVKIGNFRNMGFNVGYNANTKAFTLDNKVNDITVNFDGQDKPVRAVNIGGYNYISARDLAAVIGKTIDFKDGKIVIE